MNLHSYTYLLKCGKSSEEADAIIRAMEIKLACERSPTFAQAFAATLEKQAQEDILTPRRLPQLPRLDLRTDDQKVQDTPLTRIGLAAQDAHGYEQLHGRGPANANVEFVPRSDDPLRDRTQNTIADMTRLSPHYTDRLPPEAPPAQPEAPPAQPGWLSRNAWPLGLGAGAGALLAMHGIRNRRRKAQAQKAAAASPMPAARMGAGILSFLRSRPRFGTTVDSIDGTTPDAQQQFANMRAELARQEAIRKGQGSHDNKRQTPQPEDPQSVAGPSSVATPQDQTVAPQIQNVTGQAGVLNSKPDTKPQAAPGGSLMSGMKGTTLAGKLHA